jgi:asparaginyl-tRNA synthetase
LKGWLYNKRSSGKITFLQLRDGSGFIQGVLEKENVAEEIWKAADEITTESSCIVKGLVKEEPRSPSGYELQVTDVKIVQLSPEYPIGKKEHGPEFLFENRDLYLRSKTPWAVLRIRDQVFRSITNFFHEEGFIRFDTPILQPTSCEDTTQLFGMKYYDTMMYLTQSGQLYSEAGIMGFGKVYDFGPVFRAEKSKTRNHLSEFWMMDAEMAFHDQSMNEDVQERMVKRILKDAIEFCKEELKVLERDTTIMQKAVDTPFVRMKHYDAKKLAESLGLTVDYADDMATEEEITIGNHLQVPVFIEDYPFAVKAFYMKRYTDERGMVRARNADLIAPEEAREIIGGSQREEDFNKLLEELKSRNYSIEDYEWYLNVRKYGSVTHSGFGLGLERMVRWISGVHHIRETIPFPRTTVLSRP